MIYFDAAGERHEISAVVASVDIPTGITPAEAAQLLELAEARRVLEVGSWYGFSTVLMAHSAALVVAVDHHQGDDDAGHEETLPAFLRNLERFRLGNKVVPLVADVAAAVPFLPDRYFGLIFLDASHDQDSVERDIKVCWPKLQLGGWFAFHDYGRFGVKPPVDRLAGGRLLHVDSLAWLRKG